MLKHVKEISNGVRYGFESKDTLFISARKGDSYVREAIDNIDFSDGLARKSRRTPSCWCRSRTCLDLEQRRKLALQKIGAIE